MVGSCIYLAITMIPYVSYTDIHIDEEETEAEQEEVIDNVAQTNSPRPSES